MSHLCWFQILECEDVMLFFVIHISEYNILGFWIVVAM